MKGVADIHFLLDACLSFGLVSQQTVPTVLLFVAYSWLCGGSSDIDELSYSYVCSLVAAGITLACVDRFPAPTRDPYYVSLTTTLAAIAVFDHFGPRFVAPLVVPIMLLSLLWDFFWLPRQYFYVKTALLSVVRVTLWTGNLSLPTLLYISIAFIAGTKFWPKRINLP